jgi:hypothetical protein
MSVLYTIWVQPSSKLSKGLAVLWTRSRSGDDSERIAPGPSTPLHDIVHSALSLAVEFRRYESPTTSQPDNCSTRQTVLGHVQRLQPRELAQQFRSPVVRERIEQSDSVANALSS